MALSVKVALVGGVGSGKSALVSFFKGSNTSKGDECCETWGVQGNSLQWMYDEESTTGEGKKINFCFWEGGGAFLRKFPFYSQYILKNADIVIYCVAFPELQSQEQLTALVTQTRENWEQS